MNSWYEGLTRPPLTPPNWVFGPVWAALYIMIAVSIVLYFRAPSKPYQVITIIVLVVHLVTNFAWTSLFFGMQSPLLALLDIIVLDVTLVVLFWKASVASAVLLVPYLCWVSFATYLNAGYYLLNK